MPIPSGRFYSLLSTVNSATMNATVCTRTWPAARSAGPRRRRCACSNGGWKRSATLGEPGWNAENLARLSLHGRERGVTDEVKARGPRAQRIRSQAASDARSGSVHATLVIPPGAVRRQLWRAFARRNLELCYLITRVCGISVFDRDLDPQVVPHGLQQRGHACGQLIPGCVWLRDVVRIDIQVTHQERLTKSHAGPREGADL